MIRRITRGSSIDTLSDHPPPDRHRADRCAPQSAGRQRGRRRSGGRPPDAPRLLSAPPRLAQPQLTALGPTTAGTDRPDASGTDHSGASSVGSHPIAVAPAVARPSAIGADLPDRPPAGVPPAAIGRAVLGSGRDGCGWQASARPLSVVARPPAIDDDHGDRWSGRQHSAVIRPNGGRVDDCRRPPAQARLTATRRMGRRPEHNRPQSVRPWPRPSV